MDFDCKFRKLDENESNVGFSCTIDKTACEPKRCPFCMAMLPKPYQIGEMVFVDAIVDYGIDSFYVTVKIGDNRYDVPRHTVHRRG